MESREVNENTSESPQHAARPRAKGPSGRPTVRAPKFSVVVTCYNYGDYIEDCLSSVAAQSYSDFECIIVDDKSTDGSRDEIADFVRNAQDKRFHHIFLDRNVGQMGAMIAGFASATGNFTGFLDADDVWAPDYIRAHLAAQLNPDVSAGMSCCDMMVMDRSGHLLTGTWKDMKKIRGAEDGENRLRLRPAPEDLLKGDAPSFDPTRNTITYQRQPALAQWMFSPTSACVFRSDLLGMIMPRTGEGLSMSADYYLNMQASVLTGCLMIDAPLVYYRIHGRNGFAVNPVVGGEWYPGLWTGGVNLGLARKIVEHMESNVDLFAAVFGKPKYEDALGAFHEMVRSLQASQEKGAEGSRDVVDMTMSNPGVARVPEMPIRKSERLLQKIRRIPRKMIGT